MSELVSPKCKIMTSKLPACHARLHCLASSHSRADSVRGLSDISKTRPTRLHMSSSSAKVQAAGNYNGVHHVGLLCKDIGESLNFYQNILGMQVNEARPNDKLPYKGAWLWVGDEMIHLMELPNPDPAEGRPEHGGRDRHVCLSVNSVKDLEETLDKNGIEYTKSKSGRAALFFRDPDQNVLEMAEQ